MNSIKRINTVKNVSGTGTAAPNFHLSDTMDWSCFSSRIKNQLVIVPRYSHYVRGNSIWIADDQNLTPKPVDK